LLAQISKRFFDNDITGPQTSLQRTLDLDSSSIPARIT